MLLNYHIGCSFLVCCVLELGCGSARMVSGLLAEASAGNPDSSAITRCTAQ